VRNYEGRGNFVEAIDASNRVSVQTNLNDERQSSGRKKENEPNEKEIAPSVAYVRSAIEALAAMGVYDDSEFERAQQATTYVNVYDTNQTIINREEGKEYPEDNFFEEEEVDESNEEVDEMI